jgi:iron complex outermembrane receptor protein
VDAVTGLQSIVVTAQRRSETVQKTPIAITAFAQDAIEQQKISNFRDLSGRVPGLLAPKRSTAYTTQQYAIRGIGEVDTYPEPAVAVYVDDVYLARTVGSLYDTPDLDRVEVLRGPQGTLYGRNSSAGAIRFITKEPTSEKSADFGLTVGNYSNADVRVRLNGGILPGDKLNASLTLIRHTRDGWTHDVPLNIDVNDLDLTVVRGKLKAELTERLTVTLSLDGMRDRSSQSYYSPVNQPDGIPSGNAPNPNLTWSTVLPYNYTTVYGGSLTIKDDFTDHLTLKLVSALRGMHGPIYYDNDGVTQIKGDSYAGFNQHYATEELDLNGEFERVNFVAGLYYFTEYFHNHRLSQSASSPLDNVGSISHTNNYLRTNSFSAFGQANVKVLEALTATVGGRYTVDYRQFDNFGQLKTGANLVYPLAGNFNPDLFGTLFTDGNVTGFDVHAPWVHFSSVTPKFGLQYQPTQDLLFYGSYSRGFKSGGYDLRATTELGSTVPYRPQYTDAYEAGVKTSFLGNRVNANLAVFTNQIQDFQVRATAPASLNNGVPLSGLINAGDAHSRGLELELAAAPVTGLTLNAALSLLETGYDTFTATLPANVAGRTTLLGLRFPYAPKHQVSVAGNYRLPLPKLTYMAGVWRVGADAQYESKRYSDITNTEWVAVKPQTFVNGTVNYTAASERWTAGLQVRNLGNLQNNQAGGYVPTRAGVYPLYYYAYNEPRYVNLYLNLRF